MSHQKAPIGKALKRLPSVTKERACEAARHCIAVDLSVCSQVITASQRYPQRTTVYITSRKTQPWVHRQNAKTAKKTAGRREKNEHGEPTGATGKRCLRKIWKIDAQARPFAIGKECLRKSYAKH